MNKSWWSKLKLPAWCGRRLLVDGCKKSVCLMHWTVRDEDGEAQRKVDEDHGLICSTK